MNPAVRAVPGVRRSQIGATAALSFVAHAILLWAVFLIAGTGKKVPPIPDVYRVQIVAPPRRAASEAVRDAPAPRFATAEPVRRSTDVPAGITPGVSSTVTVDAEDFPFLYYLAALRSKVSSHWSPPGTAEARTVIFFRVYRDGTLAETYLETPSGNVVFDQAALRAVVVSEPLPPLPEEFDAEDLGVHFAFQYTLEQ